MDLIQLRGRWMSSTWPVPGGASKPGFLIGVTHIYIWTPWDGLRKVKHAYGRRTIPPEFAREVCVMLGSLIPNEVNERSL